VIAPSRLARATGVVFLAFSGLTCSLRDDPSGPGSPVIGAFQVAPVLPPNFSRFAVGLGVEQIHLVLQSGRQQAVVDTVIGFAPNATSITIRLPVLLTSTGDSLGLTLSYETLAGTVLFTGQQTILVRAGFPPTPSQVPVQYVGPGANVAYLYVTPSDSVVTFGEIALMDVQAYDSAFQPVTGVYISWQTDDPAAAIDAQGRLHAPNSLGSAVVYAQAPNGTLGGTLMYFAPGQIGITPDSIEVLPGQYHFFSVFGTLPFGSYTLSVNGIVGGDSTVGTIDIYGNYYAPSVIPSPSIVNVCARAGADSSCAKVQLATPPTPGGDLVVLGDTYLLTDQALSGQAGNRSLVNQLVTYGGSGPRVAGRSVIFDRGRNAPCLASGVCADSALNSLTTVLSNAGYSVQRVDTPSVYRNIGPGVKAIILWNPAITLTDRETNDLKRFAREGGRIVLVTDDTTSVGTGSNMHYAAGDIMYRLGINYYSAFTDAGCGAPTDISGSGIGTHQSTTGVASVRINCAVELGNNGGGYPLLVINQQTVAGVGKVDPRPYINYGD
jgi:hypothetical protein